MREVWIVGRTKRLYRVRTTDSKHDQPIEPNIQRDMPLPECPNQGWLYHSSVLDRYSRKLVGWSVDYTLHTYLQQSDLKMAIDRRRSEHGLIHH